MNEPILTNAPVPVKVSGNAIRAYSTHVRRWSGWPDATLIFGSTDESVSPFAMTDHVKREITANVDRLLLNPHRVLNTITPFRLRQEAVLTGALLHEAGHARYSHWAPRSVEEVPNFKHSDGTAPTKQTVAFARLVEEPRVEGRMAANAADNGAASMEWTMRACAAALLPATDLSADPDRAIMQIVESWVLRAGRQVAMAEAMPNYNMPEWVNEFTSMVHEAIEAHLSNHLDVVGDPKYAAITVMNTLREMIRSDDDTGSWMIDSARNVLDTLFPETDEPPMPSGGCGGGAGESGEPSPEGESGDSNESGQGGESEDSTSDDAGEGEGDEQGDDGQEDQSSGSEAQGEESETGSDSAAAKMLAAMESVADDSVMGEAKAKPKTDPTPPYAVGTGGQGLPGGTWRIPTPKEREVQKRAGKFLRDLINPTETTRRSLSETPSATVDGAALAAWRAAGERTDPMFFIRSRREVQPSPPIKIAVLVDVSGSMDVMQAPSALLSWALSSAAFDLRNFAGRGAQIESTLIHWGSGARVIQPNGVPLPGIRETECRDMTDAMGEAFGLVEQQIPGFFDVSDKPENRLLVQFTDWKLSGMCVRGAQPLFSRAMEAGVNMLSVVPTSWYNRGDLTDLMKGSPIKRGRSEIIKYNPQFPDMVWEEAEKMLGL